MPIPDTLCEALAKIKTAAHTSQPPAYTLGHVILALLYLKESPHSREVLRERLSLGEGSVKTLVKHLKNSGLVHVSKSYGTSITLKGRELVNTYEGHLKIVYNKCFFERSYTIILPGVRPPHSLVEVYLIRDYFVEEGCKSIVVGGCKDGEPVFPGLQREFMEEAKRCACIINRNEEPALAIVCPDTCYVNCLSAISRMILEKLC